MPDDKPMRVSANHYSKARRLCKDQRLGSLKNTIEIAIDDLYERKIGSKKKHEPVAA